MEKLSEQDKFDNFLIKLRNKAELYNNVNKLLSKLNNYVDNIKICDWECYYSIPCELEIRHGIKDEAFILCGFYYDVGMVTLTKWHIKNDITDNGRKFDLRSPNQLTALYNVIINYIIYGDDNIMDDRLIVDGKRIDYISSGEII